MGTDLIVVLSSVSYDCVIFHSCFSTVLAPPCLLCLFWPLILFFWHSKCFWLAQQFGETGKWTYSYGRNKKSKIFKSHFDFEQAQKRRKICNSTPLKFLFVFMKNSNDQSCHSNLLQKFLFTDKEQMDEMYDVPEKPSDSLIAGAMSVALCCILFSVNPYIWYLWKRGRRNIYMLLRISAAHINYYTTRLDEIQAFMCPESCLFLTIFLLLCREVF